MHKPPAFAKALHRKKKNMQSGGGGTRIGHGSTPVPKTRESFTPAPTWPIMHIFNIERNTSWRVLRTCLAPGAVPKAWWTAPGPASSHRGSPSSLWQAGLGGPPGGHGAWLAPPQSAAKPYEHREHGAHSSTDSLIHTQRGNQG
jgi:hypothetical protein